RARIDMLVVEVQPEALGDIPLKIERVIAGDQFLIMAARDVVGLQTHRGCAPSALLYRGVLVLSPARRTGDCPAIEQATVLELDRRVLNRPRVVVVRDVVRGNLDDVLAPGLARVRAEELERRLHRPVRAAPLGGGRITVALAVELLAAHNCAAGEDHFPAGSSTGEGYHVL